MKSSVKKIQNKRRRKLTAILLSFTMLLSIMGVFTGTAYAGAPTVTTDEAAYVNLDYYGSISEVSIVKSCSLNGLTEFRDYGTYESVANMSGKQKPVLNTDGVSWKLGSKTGPQRFYYNCAVNKDNLILPWTFDISYKLNGVPCKAEKLAGASGLVEMNIHAIPDKNAKEYYRNNMLLQVAAYINEEEAYSIDAPGSQLQALGTYKAVVFAALPGEEAEYTIRIGTDCFETKGITMMMIPGTLKQMEDIKSLKEAKDTIYDSAKALHDSLNEILTTMEGMKSGITGLKEGTEGMEDARSTFSAGKSQMNQEADQALADLNAANMQLKSLIPYFNTGQTMIKELNKDIGSMIKDLDKLKKPMSDANDNISKMQDDLEELQSMLNTLDGQIRTTLTGLGTVAMNPASGATGYDLAKLQSLGGLAGTLSADSGSMASLMSDTIDMGNTIIKITDLTNDLIEEADSLKGAMDDYEDDMLSLLGDCEKFTSQMSNCMGSTVTYLSSVKSLLQKSGDKLDVATEKSLKSMIELLDKSLNGLSSTTTLRNANNTLKNTMDEQLDKFEGENTFLNLDADAELISFTSDKNPAPESIQVILRTEEISLDKGNNATIDLEKEKEDIGFWGRLGNLFKKILGIFEK